MKINATKDYSKFELLAFNRPVMTTKDLRKSMQQYGWLGAYPMHCVRNKSNGKLKIKAGHHRFQVAKELDIPAKYVVCQDDITIHELEQATRRWSVEDYLISHIREGRNSAYQVVSAYQKSTGISASLCVAMLGGESAGSHNKDVAFKRGTYQLGDISHAEAVGHLVRYLGNVCKIDWATNSNFVRALSKVLWVEQFDLPKFKQKASTFRSLMEKQTGVAAYIDLIESIYNRHTKNKIPLAFFATNAANERNPIGR